MKRLLFLFMGLALLALAGCAPAPAADNGKLQVLATTTIVADVARSVGGEYVEVSALVETGVDEHSYEPAPQDIARASEADLILINGAGLEGFIDQLIRSAGAASAPVSVSEGITLLEPAEEEAHAGEDEEAHAEEGDPHVWTDPNNVLVWVDNIERALVEADPDHAEAYRQNAAAYRQELKDLDVWVREQVEQIPPERRILVTDHLVFTYFAARYGFEQLGSLAPGYSTLSEPSARQLAALEDSIKAAQVPVIFVGNTVSPDLADRVAQDTGTKVVRLWTGSLSEEDGPAATYLDYVRYNVGAIVGGLGVGE